MYYYSTTVNWLLIAAAVIPALYLLRFIYKHDSLEREPVGLLLSLVLLGVISTEIAIVLERLGYMVADALWYEDSLIYMLVTNFLIVGLAEELAKYVLLKKRTWNNPAFNCSFDGVVYATFVSLGFALWENIGIAVGFHHLAWFHLGMTRNVVHVGNIGVATLPLHRSEEFGVLHATTDL